MKTDENEKVRKIEENKRVYSGMRCTACVSLYCTKQSEAKHLSLSIYPAIWKMKKNEWRRKK